MPPGIDILLGDLWCARHSCALVWGNTSGKGAYVPTHAWIRSLNLRVIPRLANTSSPPPPPSMSLCMTATETRRMLHEDNDLQDTSYVVLVTAEHAEATVTPEVSAELQALLDKYSDVLDDSPDAAPFRVGTPECIKISDGVKPTNRPAFRLSMKELQEFERFVKELLESGRIEPASSPYGSSVLFVPKPDGSLRF